MFHPRAKRTDYRNEFKGMDREQLIKSKDYYTEKAIMDFEDNPQSKNWKRVDHIDRLLEKVK